MAGKEIEYRVDIDARAAQAELKRLSREAKAAGEDLEAAFDDSASAGEKARAAILSLAKVTDAELRQAALAADALAQALGPELAGKADVTKLVADLNRMGVEFNEITADADKFAATLRQIDDINVAQVDDGLANVRNRLGEVRNNADQSRSVLANLAGNQSQTAFQNMGGTIGDLGVAIGQLGEYAVDGNIGLSGLAAMAGPMATLAAAGVLAAKVFGDMAKVSESASSRLDVMRDALVEGTDAWETFNEQVRETGELTFEDDGLFGTNFGATVQNVVDDLANLGLTLEDFERIVGDTAEEQRWRDLLEEWKDTGDVSTVTANSLLQMLDAVDAYQATSEEAARVAADVNAVIGDTSLSVDDATEAWNRFKDAAFLESMPADFLLFGDQLAKGVLDVDQLNRMMERYGLTADEVFERSTQAVEEHNQKLEEARQHAFDMAEAAAKINEILSQTPDFAAGISAELDKVDTALERVTFDANFEESMAEALDGLAGFEPDLQTMADRWSDILAGVDIDILGNVRADDAEAVAAIQQVADLFQEGLVAEFEEGGRDAANAFVREQAAAIAEASGLDISEVYRLMGLPADGSIDTVVQPSIDAAAAEKARAILDVLAGTSDDPRIAELQLRMLTDEDYPPEQAAADAAALAQDVLDDSPLEITMKAEADTTKAEGKLTDVVSKPRTATVGTELQQQMIGNLILAAFLDHVARPRTASIGVELTGWQLANSLLTMLTQQRTAHVNVVVDNYWEVERQLEQLTRNRTALVTTRLGGGRNGAFA